MLLQSLHVGGRSTGQLTADEGEAGDDPGIDGPGVLMRDMDYSNTCKPHYYFLYENGQDDHPWKYTLVRAPTTNPQEACGLTPSN